MKYITAAIAFIFVWFVSSLLIGFILVLIIRPDRPVFIGIGFDWINLPGTILGLLAGLHSAKATIRTANAKASKKKEKDNKSSSVN